MAALHVPVGQRPLRGFAVACVLTLCGLASACAGAQPAGPAAETVLPAADNGSPAAAEADNAETTLTPAMRYWQIRFLLGITEGIDEPLLDALQERFGPPDGSVPDIPRMTDFQGAGYRIASAESILDGLADLAAFRAVAEDDLLAEQARLLDEAAVTIDALDEELLAEEILLVRSAILDSLETLADQDDWRPVLNDSYRVGTLRARNELEYVVFAREMDALAERNIDESTGRLDAFHRMMDDGNDTAFLRERVMAAEEMNRQITDEHREYATRRTIRTLFFLLPALSSYFRYR